MNLKNLGMLLASASILLPACAAAQAEFSSGRDAPPPVASATPVAPEPDQNAPAPTAGAPHDGDIVVTARRRDERLQDVPVSITAFDQKALERSTVQQLADIRTITPGLNFSAEGGKDNTSVSLRGIGQIPLGEGTPGVVTYINDVPIPANGSNIPTYDVSSVQVLKGPQGTLFGRNTLGGAVLLGTNTPTYDLGGYLQGVYGRFDYREIQGAINLPIVRDRVALRIAGQVRRQDGRTENLNGGRDFDNIRQDGVRVTLLLEPVDGLKSTTVAEYFKSSDEGGGAYLLRQNFSFSNLFVPSLGPVVGNLFGSSLDAQVQANLRNRKFYGAFDDGAADNFSTRRTKSITNDTSYSFGDFTLRNIFGYRESRFAQSLNTGGVGPLTLPTALLGAPANTPFTLFRASQQIQRKYLTEEGQFLGTFAWGNFILGGFYSKDESDGPSGSSFVAFATPATPGSLVTAQVRNESYAFYGQAGINITEKLKLNIGGRYSWENTSACGGAFATGYVTDATCRTAAARNVVDGIGVVTNNDKAPNWTIGLDYKATPDLLLYVVSRRGFRGANVNTPLFESQFTTGGPGCASGRCPDLRPFQRTGRETVTDAEIGEKFSTVISGARFRFNTAVFYSKYKNALQFLNASTLGIPLNAPDSPTNGSLGANVADLTIWGVEVESSVSPTRNFTVAFNGAYTNQKVDKVNLPSGLSVPFNAALITLPAATFAGTVSASWTLPIHPVDGNVILNADLYMTADFGGQYGEKLPGYSLANARLDWQNIGRSGIDLGVFVKNVFGERYLSAPVVLVPFLPTSSAFVGEPRTWGVVGRFRF